nr:PBP1A family penicillin-binding protein [Paenibacillus sediminis]
MKRTFRAITTAALLLVIAALIVLVYLYQKDLPIADSDRNSRLLDSQGGVIGTFSSSGRNDEPVTLGEISPDLINATLAVEDRNFYNHVGFDLKGLGRAVLVNLEHMNTVQGASTITQQLARNLYLSHEKTWSRKAKEAMYTIQLEMKYSKQDILQMYLNEIYYGHGAYGVEAASQLYFGKHAKDLTLAESAMLAGVPKGPTYYSPYNHMKNAKDRQKIVLSAMVQTGAITQAQANAAYNEILAFQPLDNRMVVDKAPYFRDYVRSVVINDLGFDQSLLDHGGLNIYTTLDAQAQEAADQAVAAQMDSKSELEVALVSIDPRNGYIKALVGGKNYRTNQYNHVFATTRQPGSSFKPIMYLTALSSKKMTSASRFNSQPTLFHYDNNRKTYQPSNFGDKYLGEIDMRQAIAASDNIYAVNTVMNIGVDQVIDMSRKLGIDSPLEAVPSLALGTSPVSPFEMAAAFSVISNEGKRVKPVAVLKITDATGNVLYEAPPAQSEQVVDPASAYVLTQLMESVFEGGGTGNRVASMIKRPVAGKTGTTNTDGWLVGFTPELSTAVWVGYDKGKTVTATDTRKAAPIFASYTEQALKNVPPKIFPIPDGVVSVYIDPTTGKLATEDCPNKRLEVFIEGTQPTEYCSSHGGEHLEPTQHEQSSKKSWWQQFKRWWTE